MSARCFAEAREHVVMLQPAQQRAHRSVGDLLDVHVLGAGRRSLTPVRSDPVAVAREVAERLAVLAVARQVPRVCPSPYPRSAVRPIAVLP
jgi:hypothetical protein